MSGLFLFNQVGAQQSEQRSCQVIASFPFPGPSPQDLAWDGNYLWVADDSTDTIYKLDPLNGKVLLSFASPGLESKGLACDEKHLWLSGNGAAEIYKFDLSGKFANRPVLSINAPVVKLGRGVFYYGRLNKGGSVLSIFCACSTGLNFGKGCI